MIEGVISGYRLSSRNVRRSHIRELYYFELYLGDKFLGRCHYFTGRGEYVPWIELDYDPWPRREGIEVDLFKFFYDLLPPLGRLFVTYEKDKETEEMIFKGYHAAETPLGFSMLRAGFTWFKVWYYPEGGNEGAPKLQGNKPLNEEDARRELEEMLEEIKREEVRKWVLGHVKGK